MVELGILPGLTALQVADLRDELGELVFTDTVTLKTIAETLNAAGEIVLAESTSAKKGKVLRQAEEGMNATAFGLSGLEAYLVLLEDTAAPRAGMEATSSEWGAPGFELQDAAQVKVFGTDVLYWICRAIRKRAT